jgi:hypothetical protein
MSIETITDLARALPSVGTSKTYIKKKRPVVAPTATPVSKVNSTIDKVYDYISAIPNQNILLLKNKEVIQWLFYDTSFLPPIEKKNKTQDTKKYKVLEDEWGRKITKFRRPDLKLDKQWTTCFGQHLIEELYTILGYEVTKPIKKEHFQPDLEISDSIIEVKAETYFTDGTAGEKILGVPFKYADVPILYAKPLKIVCLGGAEKACKEQYGNLGDDKCTPQKKIFLDFFKTNGIEYIGATDVLKSLITN